MKGIKLILVVVLLAGLPVTATCTEKALTLEDVKWSLFAYGPMTITKPLLPDTQVTVFFDSEKKEVSGSGGCNTYFADYEVDGENLTIMGPIAVTEMWCGDEIGEQEHKYLGILLAAESYHVEQDSLRINSGNRVLNFECE